MVAQEIIRIRNIKDGDLHPVHKIAKNSFKDPYPLRLLRHIHETNPDGFLIAEIGGEVVGYLIGVTRWGGIGHILAIAVKESHRREGVGSALMINALNQLKEEGASRAKLEVRASNEGAQKFYKRMGFESKEVVPAYYSDGEAAVSMKYKF